jgi:hypothetical protein
VPVLEILVLALTIPGAIAAVGDLWTRRQVARRDPQTGTTGLDVSLRFSIRRTREPRPNRAGSG